MPVYCYRCHACEAEFEVRHSMSFDDQSCTLCESKSVFRIPSLTEIKKSFTSTKPGKVVREYIEDVKQEIKNEKTKLRSEEI